MKTRNSTHSFRLNGKEYSFTLTKRNGQKHIRLKIGKDGTISVSAPQAVALSRVDLLIEEKKGWIEKHIGKQQEALKLYDPLKRIPYFGEWFDVIHDGRKRKGTVRINKELQTIHIDSESCDPTHIKKILHRKLIKEAKKIVPPKMIAWSENLNIPHASVSIRNQKTRWGSSSTSGHISINWRIICTPERVQDYLIVHELLHQRLHNHSKNYWKELEQIFPGAKKYDGWLKQHNMIMSILR